MGTRLRSSSLVLPVLYGLVLSGLVLLLASCGPGLPLSGGSSGSGGDGTQLAGGGTGGSGDGGGDSGDGGGGTSSIEIDLIGRYAPGIQALDVTVQGIDLHSASASDSVEDGWRALPLASQTVDILTLTDGNEALLVDAAVQPGTYDKLRVRFRDATVTVFDLTHSMLLTDDGQSIASSRALVTVEEDGVYLVTLDFDPIPSVQSTNGENFLLNPALSVVVPEEQGSISGAVSPLDIDAVVSAYESLTGKLVASAAVRENGSYILPRLQAMDGSGRTLRYDLDATAPDYLRSNRYRGVTVVPGEDSPGYDFTLTPEDADSSDSGATRDWWESGSRSDWR